MLAMQGRWKSASWLPLAYVCAGQPEAPLLSATEADCEGCLFPRVWPPGHAVADTDGAGEPV